jgi:hypothetical protein
MRIIVLALAGALAVALPVMGQPAEMRVIPTPHKFEVLLQRIERAVERHGLAVVAKASASQGAAARGIRIPSSTGSRASWMSSLPASQPTRPAAERAQPLALAGALAATIALAAAVSQHGARMPALLALGVLLGATLYLASFGFASAYRRLIEAGDVSGVRAQLLMLGAATFLFAPVLAQGWRRAGSPTLRR